MGHTLNQKHHVGKNKMSQYNAVPNSIVLMFILGWQGGTIHQVAETLGVSVADIQNADYLRMEELMRLAQTKRNPS